ncbi:MAG: hypothetical protein WKF94_16490 [Solirubrobacteraceae bacterium]
MADLTTRAAGGAVLLAGAVVCALEFAPRIGAARTAALLVVTAAAFVASHPLGDAIGTWPAVLSSAAVVAVAASGLLIASRG